MIGALDAGGMRPTRLRSVTAGAWTPGAAPPDAATLGHALAADLGGAREGRGATLVLDDAHLVDGTATPAALRRAIGALSPGTVLALGSRIDPALGLARLRASGRLVELRAEDLAFTADETADLLADGLGV